MSLTGDFDVFGDAKKTSREAVGNLLKKLRGE